MGCGILAPAVNVGLDKNAGLMQEPFILVRHKPGGRYDIETLFESVWQFAIEYRARFQGSLLTVFEFVQKSNSKGYAHFHWFLIIGFLFLIDCCCLNFCPHTLNGNQSYNNISRYLGIR